MQTRTSMSIAAAAMLLAMGAARAADATNADGSPNTDSDLIKEADRAAEKAANEPNVKRTVIDDRHARIEELRVRGQLQKVVVHPKDGAPGYEIIVSSGSPEQAFSAGQAGSRGSSGKRVWNLLQF